VVTLDASLIEVVTEGRLHWASVRFSGAIREDAGATATPFEEIWHLQKPMDGSSGWLLAGIQQVG
jgi:predicted lipid-binding transport protein (Tim44 family)